MKKFAFIVALILAALACHGQQVNKTPDALTPATAWGPLDILIGETNMLGTARSTRTTTISNLLQVMTGLPNWPAGGSPTGGVAVAKSESIDIATNGSVVTPRVHGGFQYVVNAALAPYSVDPTGVSDASTALNQALSDIATNSSSLGAILQLPAGIIKLSSPLVIPGIDTNNNLFGPSAQIEVRGMGASTILDARTQLTGSAITDTNIGYRVRFKEFVLVGPGVILSNSQFRVPTISLYLGTNYQSTGLALGNYGAAFGTGVNFTLQMHEPALENVDIFGFATGLGATNTTELKVSQCRFFGNTVEDASFVKCDNMLAQSCSFGWQTYSTSGIKYGTNWVASMFAFQGVQAAYIDCEWYGAKNLIYSDNQPATYLGCLFEKNNEGGAADNWTTFTNGAVVTFTQLQVGNGSTFDGTNNALFALWGGAGGNAAGGDFMTLNNVQNGSASRTFIETLAVADPFFAPPVITGGFMGDEATNNFELRQIGSSTNYYHLSRSKDRWQLNGSLKVMPYGTAIGITMDPSQSGGNMTEINTPLNSQGVRIHAGSVTGTSGATIQLFGASDPSFPGQMYFDTPSFGGPIFFRPTGSTAVIVDSNLVQVQKGFLLTGAETNSSMGLGVLHSSSAGARSSSTIVPTDMANTGTAGTYRSVTFNSQGLETSGSNPTTFSGYAISDTSANLGAALTDGTGKTGLAVFSNGPTTTNQTTKGDQYGTNALSVTVNRVDITNNLGGFTQTGVNNTNTGGTGVGGQLIVSGGVNLKSVGSASAQWMVGMDVNGNLVTNAIPGGGSGVTSFDTRSGAVVFSGLTDFPNALTNNDSRTGGAVLNEPLTGTNLASGYQIIPTGTNITVIFWGTNSAGTTLTNKLVFSPGNFGSGYNLELQNTNGVDTFTVTQDGWITFGTNKLAQISTNGIASFAGETNSATTAWTLDARGVGKQVVSVPNTTTGNPIVNSGTTVPPYETNCVPYSVTATNLQIAIATNQVYQSNIISAVLTFASASNSLPVYEGGGDFLLVSATPTAITNVTGSTAGYIYQNDITISNSTAAAFTNWITVPAAKARGYAATNALAVLGFNGAVVPASGEIFLHFETRGVNETNYWISY